MIKFGLIGYGNIAKKFTKSIEFVKGGCIRAIASKSMQEDDPYLLTHPNVKLYRDYTKMLEDKEIGAVYVALPHQYHLEWIVAALKHHKAVLSEKPLVLQADDVKEIIEVSNAQQTYCLEALKTKFNTGFMALQKDLALIGEVTKVEANFCFDSTDNREGSYLFNQKQGGALNDVGTYLLAFVLGVVQQQLISVSCKVCLENKIDLAFEATLTFENNCQAVIEGAINQNKERFATIYGTQGKIHVPYFNRVINYEIETDQETILRSYPIQGDDMTMEIQALVDDVKQGLTQSPIHSLNDSLVIAQIIEAIREAMNQ